MATHSLQSTMPPAEEKALARSPAALLFLLLVSVLAAVVFWLIYSKLLLIRGPFISDEGVHALKGVQFADDFQRGDWLGLLLDSYRQVLYPPLHSWLIAIAYLVNGPSVVSSGTVGLICFVAMAPILFCAGYLLHDEYGVVAGIVAALLLLTSPQLVRFSTQIMLEDPGLLTICLTILIYFWLVRNRIAPPGYILLALGVVVTYFIRMPYGVLLAIAVMAVMLVEAKFTPAALWRRQCFYLILTLLLVFIPWFAYVPKIFSTWQWLLNVPDPDIKEPYGLTGWLFYFWAFVPLSASLWHLLLAVLSIFFCAVSFWHDARIRFLLVLIIVQFVLAELNQNKQLRNVFPMLPALFLLSGFTLAELWRWARSRQSSLVRWLPAFLTAAFVLYSGYLLFETIQEQQGELIATTSGANAVHTTNEAVANAVRQTGVSLVLSSTDLVNPTPAMLDWHLIGEAHLMEAPLAGSLAQVDEERKILAMLHKLPLPAWLIVQFQQALTRSEMPNKTRSLYVDLPVRATYSQSQAGLNRFIHGLMSVSKYAGVIVITANSKAAKYPLSYFEPALEAEGLHHQADRTVHAGPYQIDIYQ